MAERFDDHEVQDEEHGPAEDSETGSIGNVDERSSENRREGLEKDRERARRPEEVDRREE